MKENQDIVSEVSSLGKEFWEAKIVPTVSKDDEGVLGLGAWKPLVAWAGTALAEWMLGSRESDSG